MVATGMVAAGTVVLRVIAESVGAADAVLPPCVPVRLIGWILRGVLSEVVLAGEYRAEPSANEKLLEDDALLCQFVPVRCSAAIRVLATERSYSIFKNPWRFLGVTVCDESS